MRPRRRSAAVVILLLATACTSVNPATGRREIILMSPEQERQIDARESKQVEAQLGIVKDPKLTAYVEAIGKAIAKYSPRQDVDYRFQIVEMDEPNAFALPGGHIYISRGLLTVANSEDELANVIGHEIGHVAARHAAEQQAHVETLGLATLLSDLMSGAREQPESESLSGNFVARYARNQEREADRIGQELAEKAGLDPSGLARFLRTLDNLSRISQGFSEPQGYFSTHPTSRERMLEATNRAQDYEWRRGKNAPLEWGGGFAVASTRDEYLERIEGITVGRPASEGVFVDDHFLHPDLDFSVRFPHGWDYSNQNSQVVAVSPKHDGVAVLQLDSQGDDPVAAARAYAEHEKLRLENGTPIHIGEQRAFRAETVLTTKLGRTHAEITWVAYGGRVYRLIGGIREGSLRRYEGIFRKFAQSFRPLSPEARRQITELRLRIATAKPGESIEALSARTHNEWGPLYTAVVNGLPVGAPLPGGQRLKVAVREPYEPAKGAATR